MGQQVKFRADQPLFKAQALRFPLWLHLPAEVIRLLWQWHTATMHRDNPHRNPLWNATLLQPAKRAHRLAYWSGREVTMPPKWRRIAVRNFLSWFLIASLIVEPIRSFVWPNVFVGLREMLIWVGLTLVPFLWHNWLWIPVIVAGIGFGSVGLLRGLRWGFRRYNRWVWLGGWQRTGVLLARGCAAAKGYVLSKVRRGTP
jgi:hypothetical protein